MQKIKEGGNFIQLAKVHSDDRKSALNGGLIKSKVWTQWEDPVMSTAFKLDEGEISDVTEVDNGFVIIQIESIEPNNLESYKKMRESLRSRLLAQRRPELRAYYNEYWQNLKDESALVFNDSLIRFLSQLFLENINHADKFVRLCKEHEASVENDNIVTYQQSKISMSDLAKRMSEADIRVKIMLRDSSKLRDYITNQALLDVLYNMAKEKRLDQSLSVKKEINDKAEKLMLDKINEIEIDSKIILHEDSLKAYYKKHLYDKYSRKERVKIQEVVLKDKDKARDVYKKAKAGANFTALVKRYSQREITKKKDGYVGFFFRGAHGKVGDMAFQMKNNEIGGPVELPDGQFIVFKRIDYKPLEHEDFDKIREDVKYDYRKELKQTLADQFISQLKEKYPVEIYKEQMENIVEYN